HRHAQSFPPRRSSDLTGVVKEAVVVAGRDAPVLAEYGRERLLAASLRERWDHEGRRAGAVLALALDVPMLAELGAAARTVSWYEDRKSTRLNSSHVKI